MREVEEQQLHRAIDSLSQSDPIIKLLQEVRLGRMRPTDAGLRAITEAWLGTYQKVLQTTVLGQQALIRLDPSPRLEVLIEAGVLIPDHQVVSSLRATFEKALAQAASE